MSGIVADLCGFALSSVAEAVCAVVRLSARGLALTVACMYLTKESISKQKPRTEAAASWSTRASFLLFPAALSGPTCDLSYISHPEEPELHQLRRRGPVIGLLAQARVYNLLERLSPNTTVVTPSISLSLPSQPCRFSSPWQ